MLMTEACSRSYGQNVKVISRIFYFTPYSKISSSEALLVWIRGLTLGVKMHPCNKGEGSRPRPPMPCNKKEGGRGLDPPCHATKWRGSRPRHFFLYTNKSRNNFESSHTLLMSWSQTEDRGTTILPSSRPHHFIHDLQKKSQRPSILCGNL